MNSAPRIARAIVTASLAASACADRSTALDDREVVERVTAAAGAPRVRSLVPVVSFTVAVTIANASAVPVYFSGACGLALQRAVAGAWATVYAPVCTLDARAPIEIPAGEGRTVELAVAATPGYGSTAGWTPPVGGEYRVMSVVWTARAMLPERSRVTPTFRLTGE